MSLSDWSDVNLDSVADIVDGDRGVNYPTQHEFSSYGDCLFLNAGNVTQLGFNFTNCSFITKEKDALLRKGKLRRQDIVLTTRGTVGNVAYYDRSIPFDNIRINSGMVIFRPEATKIDPLFLYIFLRSKVFEDQVKGLTTGSAQPQLPIRDIRRICLPLPDTNSQKAIAAILGALDDKIELNRRMNTTLEAMARALFKSWFVDFDPVRAKSEGCHPFGMDAETAALFPSRLVASDLGDIPEGWKVCRLEDAIAINPTTRLDKETVASYLDMFALPTSGFSPEKPILRKVSSGSRFQNGDTLLARITPCLENGKTAFVDCLETNQIGWGSTEFIVLRPRDPVPPAYGYLLARSEEFRAYAIQSMTGTSGRQRVPSEALVRYKIAVSSDLIYREFGNRVKGWFAVIGENARQNDVLEKTRDYLLPKLISGDIRIRDAKKFVEAA